MDDLKERLRAIPGVMFDYDGQEGIEDATICKEAADRIESLEAQLAKRDAEIVAEKTRGEVYKGAAFWWMKWPAYKPSPDFMEVVSASMYAALQLFEREGPYSAKDAADAIEAGAYKESE